jgi:hypothetical protein
MSWEYGALAAEVYELDKPVGRPFADVRYYTGLLADISGPILESATGTGRVLIPLLEAGHQVEGLDSSPNTTRQQARQPDSSATTNGRMESSA